MTQRASKVQPATLQSADAERAVLGSVLIGGGHVLDSIQWLKPSDFVELKHAWIYEAMQTLHAEGQPVDDLLILSEEMRARNQFDQAGGHAYLTELINATPTHIYADNYAAVVESLSRRRRALASLTTLQETAARGDSSELAAQLDRLRSQLAERTEINNPLRQFLIHIAELEKMQPVQWLIEGELPEQGIIIIYGPSGVGKSFLALDYALKLASGMPVLYVATEGEWGYRQRVLAWSKHHKREVSGYKMYFFMSAVALLDPKEYQQFSAIAKLVQPRLLVIDTLAHSMLPGDENSARDMGNYIKAAKALQRAFKCAVILVHHTNKGGYDERGSGALRGAADTMFRMADEDDVTLVECTKSKDAAKSAPRYVRLLSIQIDDQLSAPVLVPAEKVIRAASDPLSPTQQLLVDTLCQPMFADGASVADLQDMLAKNRGAIYKAMAVLMKHNFVRKEGSLYALTDEGQRRITKVGGEMIPMIPVVAKNVSSVSADARPMIPMIPQNGGVSAAKAASGESRNHVNHGDNGSTRRNSLETKKESSESSESSLDFITQRNLWGARDDADSYYRQGG